MRIILWVHNMSINESGIECFDCGNYNCAKFFCEKCLNKRLSHIYNIKPNLRTERIDKLIADNKRLVTENNDLRNEIKEIEQLLDKLSNKQNYQLNDIIKKKDIKINLLLEDIKEHNKLILLLYKQKNITKFLYSKLYLISRW